MREREKLGFTRGACFAHGRANSATCSGDLFVSRTLRAHLDEPTYIRSEPQTEGDGFGAINAARGSLEHWVRIRDGKIANYQIITPTAWNGSPRDNTGRRGHWEESFVGLEIEDLDNPVELFHVVRSHDACLVCTVHVASGRGASRRFTFA